MHTRPLVALALLLALPMVDAASVDAPELVLSGTLQVRLEHDPGIVAARFLVDDEVVYQASNLSLSALVLKAPVADGHHSFLLEAMVRTESGDLQVQVFEGEVDAQNLEPLIRRAVSHIAESSRGAEEAAEEALQVASLAVTEAHNASLAAQSIQVPPDLARQQDLVGLAAAADANADALTSLLQSMQENQERFNAEQAAMVQARLDGMERSFTVLVILLALTMTLLLFAIVRLRRAANFSDDDRVLLRAMSLHVGLTNQSPALQQAHASLDSPAKSRRAQRRQRVEASNEDEANEAPRRRRGAST